jgi:hemoglobin/transferrin/lactoferrin receptor protein|tara:strand:+ start:251 stop:2458 length:2208 start_codon:yes stop_codon:yes gene_type:complete
MSFETSSFYQLKLGLVFIGGLTLTQNSYSQDEVEEIVVISSRTPLPLSEVVGSVSTINLEDMDTRIVANMADIVDKTVGVSVGRNEYLGRSVNGGYSIRGLGGKRVNILLDGVRVADAYTGYGRDLVDTDLLSRVEILKGPSSALYGSDGLAGAVSYITKDPKDLADVGDSYLSFLSSYDFSSDQEKVNILAARSGERLSGIFQATKRNLNDLEPHGDAKLEPNKMDGTQKSLFAKLKYELTTNTELALTLDSQEWDADWDLETELGFSYYPTPIATSSSLGVDEGTRDRVSLTLSSSMETVFFDSFEISLFSQDTDQKQTTITSKSKFLSGMRAPPTAFNEFRDYRFNQNIQGLALNAFKEIGSHQIVYGYEYEEIEVERVRYKDETNLRTGAKNYNIGGELYPNKTFPDTTTTRVGFYISDRVSITEDQTLVFGARYDGYELDPQTDSLFNNSNVLKNKLAYINDSEVSLKLGYLYDFADYASIFIQYAEGFRSPDYESANISFTNFAYYYGLEPNPSLEAESSDGFELGLRGGFGDLGNARWAITAFKNNYENFIESGISRTTARGLTIYSYQNKDDVEIEGFEAELSGRITNNLEASLALIVSEGEDSNTGETILSVNPDEAIFSIDWKPRNNLSVNSYLTYRDGIGGSLKPSCGRSGCQARLQLEDIVTLDTYVSMNLSDSLKLRFGIENITNKKFWNWPTVAGKNANDSNLDLLLEPGRSLRLSIRYEL